METLASAILLAAIAISQAPAQQSCKPEFPFRDGWWGADGGYSMLLPTGETLWLFDDSFVGAAKSQKPFRHEDGQLDRRARVV